MTTLIKNVRLLDAHQDFIGDILFDNKIIAIEKNINDTVDNEIDGTNLLLFPSFVDPHVHFRTPGLEHKEDFYTGGLSALAGGVTMVFDMPNTVPPVFTNEILNNKKGILDKLSPLNYGVFFCGNNDNIEEIINTKNIPGVKLFLNDTTGHLLLENRQAWKNIFLTGKKITLHAEGDTFLEAVEIWKSLKTPCTLHLAHMTLKKELEAIKLLKQDPDTKHLISCEVCPHHLFFSQKDLENFPALRMKPELAQEEDRLALWEGIEEGWIDCFASDHAPHLWTEKQTSSPAFGVPGVASIFPLIFTEWQKRKWDLKKFSQMMTANSLKIYKVKNRKGFLEKGFDADLVLINPHKKYIINAQNLYSKCNWTPFEGFVSEARIQQTFLGGNLVFDGNCFHSFKIANKAVQFE